jgi:hypothetical protein
LVKKHDIEVILGGVRVSMLVLPYTKVGTGSRLVSPAQRCLCGDGGFGAVGHTDKLTTIL